MHVGHDTSDSESVHHHRLWGRLKIRFLIFEALKGEKLHSQLFSIFRNKNFQIFYNFFSTFCSKLENQLCAVSFVRASRAEPKRLLSVPCHGRLIHGHFLGQGGQISLQLRFSMTGRFEIDTNRTTPLYSLAYYSSSVKL